MTKVLAAIDNSAAARPVLATARALANLLSAGVEAVHVSEDGEANARAAAVAARVALRSLVGRPVVDGLVEEGSARDVAVLVLGARGMEVGRRPAGHVAIRLAVSLPKPIVVVPPEARVPGVLARILVPLSDAEATAAAVVRILQLAPRQELELVVLHVHDEASIPLFSDQPQYELEAWGHEFLRRRCPFPDQVRLEVRIGIPGENVLHVAEEIGADMIALAWSQDLSPGRAAVVREVLERSSVPVLLTPVEVGSPAEDPVAQDSRRASIDPTGATRETLRR